MTRALLAAAVLAGLLAADASASIAVATNVNRASLRVDARGNAEIRWATGSVLVPATGRLLPGGRLSGPDVSRAVTTFRLPFQRALRRTPDGRYWALQVWQPNVGGPTEVRFSRWRGAPTKMTLTTRPVRQTELLEGRVTFAGRPVTGFWRTNAGTPVRHVAFVQCFGCQRRGVWTTVTGKRTLANGTFALTIAPRWQSPRYRATIVGPNRGTTYAPDASAVAPSAL